MSCTQQGLVRIRAPVQVKYLTRITQKLSAYILYRFKYCFVIGPKLNLSIFCCANYRTKNSCCTEWKLCFKFVLFFMGQCYDLSLLCIFGSRAKEEINEEAQRMLNGHIREDEKVIRQSGKTDSFNQNIVMREIAFQNSFQS